ncbi:hypothetical protein BDK61_2055 [Haloarcula quadrata]|uniref:Uncharacterized protein n=1 Tax=Haloarcula quadrata TaxID=182779 RepID=A0A495R692_9EURY|nr:hypothetical protein [Haloarcula quadrata]RKS82740.1 hypothetical protein BDK61_2055 [Haloarcula quadrata]
MRKVFVALCVLVASAGLGMGSGGFSSVDADRAVTVDVVGDESAYMSLDYSNETVDPTDGTKEVEFVTVANHFAEVVDFRIYFTVTGGLTADSSSNPIIEKNVGVGENIDGTVTLECDSSDSTYSTAIIDFNVVADGDGVWAETTAKRTVEYEADCE